MNEPDNPRLIVDGRPVAFRTGDTVLLALLRAGLHPTGGGCLCMAGDCPNCLASVEGIGYVRTCQVAARAGLSVENTHAGGRTPRLLHETQPPASMTTAEHLHCDVVVIGRGEAGRRAAETARLAGKDVITLDARGELIEPGGPGSSADRANQATEAHAEATANTYAERAVQRRLDGEEVIGIYPGPRVVARTADSVWSVYPREEIVVATGASEIFPVVPGSNLRGLFTARAIETANQAGIELGRVVAVGVPPSGLSAQHIAGELVRFDGADGPPSAATTAGAAQLQAVVMRDAQGKEHRYQCDSVSLALGTSPRDALARMARNAPSTAGSAEITDSGCRVRVVGDAALAPVLPACPEEGTVCPCSGVTFADLEQAIKNGFRELELLKRATLAGTGTCQGAVCLPYLRSFLAANGTPLQAPFTARPVTRQLTLAEAAAGAYHRATPRTALDSEHRRRGAQMERAGGWWRPWRYGKGDTEYWAVREAVSICDVSTLGKMLVSGPDALELLERLYPAKISTLKKGHSRYVLLLDERGYVLDDGMVTRLSESRFSLSFTSGGATHAELWVRDWADSWGLDVRLLNRTLSQGAINLTGPRATELLRRAGVDEPPAYLGHAEATVAGIVCDVHRLSFTGELSYELHHAANDSVALWRALLALGKDLGIVPHGLETLLRLRLEKGHLVVGQDTDFASTPRRLGHEWAVKLDKDDFVGKAAVERTNQQPLDRQLVGLEMRGPAPAEGAVIRYARGAHRGEYAGYVTSSTYSPVLGRSVLLGWVALEDRPPDRSTGSARALPDEVLVQWRSAKRCATPFYDPEGARPRTDAQPQEPRSTRQGPPPRSPGHDWTTGRRRLEWVPAARLVARAESLDRAHVPSGLLLRVAPDEAIFIPHQPRSDRTDKQTQQLVDDTSGTNQRQRFGIELDDPHAIVVADGGLMGGWMPRGEALAFLRQSCEWELPNTVPAFAQGAVAGLPLKLWFEEDRVLFVVPAPFALDLEDRLP